MDEEIFPVLCPNKTYSKSIKKITESNNVQKIGTSKKSYDPGVPLTTKVAVEYLLNGKLKTNVCRYCLKVTVGLSELDQIMHIAGTGVIYKVSIRAMIACFYPVKARQEANFPEKICQKCLDRALNAYLFTQQCEQAERALQNCFDDMSEKIIKLDPIDRPKKRGRQKLNPNYNVLYAEHFNVMDYAEPLRNIINSETESLSKEPGWNEFECKRCWQVLPNLESLLNHEQQHPKYMWYHCRLCGKSFVKINQLKKHFTQVHIRGKGDKDEVDKTFKCNECGNITETYVKHLQHIEKHKFKSIMQSIVEKKTNQLCLVCLKKSTHLVEMDKMISINGSCPELVGDKSLYTVLASTLPDKSYKYQELHIPHKADIMTIKNRIHKPILNVPFTTAIQFKLSLPKIIMKNKFKTDDFYHYIFCEPQTSNYNVITTMNHENKYPIFNEIIVDYKLDHNMQTNQGMSVIEHSRNGDQMPNDNKKLFIAAENYHPVTEMDLEETESLNCIKSVANNNVKQMELLENVNPCDKTVTSHTLTAKILCEDNQTIDLIANSHVRKDIYDVKEAMDVVGCSVHSIQTDNAEDTIMLGEKDPAKLIKPSHVEDVTAPIFNFSDPIAVAYYENPTNLKLDVDMVAIFNFSKPDYIGKPSDQELYTIKLIKQSDIPDNDIRPIKLTTGLSWIFTKASDKYNSVKDNEVTDNVNNIITETKTKEGCCKFCWLFKHFNKCEYCKKPSDKVVKITNEDKRKIEKNTVLDNKTNENIVELSDTANLYYKYEETPKEMENFDKELKIWQCNVCLTNNNKDRSTCHCCESNKYFDNINSKVRFGINKTFFYQTLGIENKEETNMEKVIDKFNKETMPFIVMDEATMMDAKSCSMQENIEIQMDSVKDTNSVHSMDVETDSCTHTLNTKAITNEEMDIEEEPFIPIANTAQKFDPTLSHTLAANIVPYFGTPNIATEHSIQLGTNIHFNIGSNLKQTEKPLRKIKRAVRNMSKAFHK